MRPAKHEAHLGCQGKEVSELMPLCEVGGEDFRSAAVDDGNERQVEFGGVPSLEGDGVVLIAQFVAEICENGLALRNECLDALVQFRVAMDFAENGFGGV